MQLTNSALSMLLKRYRAVLFKCRTLNWLGGTVLAAGLVLGAASGALAEDVVWTKNADVVPTPDFAENPLTIKTGTDFVIDETKTPAGINLTVSDGAQITVNGSGKWYQTGLFGYSAAADTNDAAAVPTTITGEGTQITVTKGAVGAGLPGDGNGTGPYAFTISDGAKIILQGDAANEAVILAAALKPGQMVTTISGENTAVEVADGKHGTLDTPYGNVTVTNGATVEAKGTLSLIAGGLPQTVDGAYNAANASTATVSIAEGGTLNVAATGTVNANRGVTLALAGGTIKNAGTLAAVDGGHVDLSATGTVTNDSAGTFSVSNQGHMKFSQANLDNVLTAGKVNIGANGLVSGESLALDGTKLKNAAPGAGEIGFSAAGGVLKATNLTVTGTPIGASDGANIGTLEANRMLLGSGADVTVNKFTLKLSGEGANLSLAQAARATASLNLGAGATVIASGPDATVATPVTLNGAGAELQVTESGTATFEDNVTVTNGTFSVAAGSTATMDKTLSFADTSNASTINGTLNVTGENSSLVTAATAAPTINAGGVVNATAAALGLKSDGSDAATPTLNDALDAKAGSTINISGLDEGGIDKTEAQNIVTKVTGGNGGMIDIGDTAINDLTISDGKVAASELTGLEGLTNTQLAQAAVSGVTGAGQVTSAVAGVELADGTNTLDYNANDQQVQLLGSSDDGDYQLVSKNNGERADVNFSGNTGQVLTLGKGDADNSGTLGTVTFFDASNVFNALGENNEGTFNVESFAADAAGDGNVNIQGVKVVTKAVGSATNNVNDVKVTNGTLTVDDGAANTSLINTATLTVDNATVSARDGITASGATTLKGGIVSTTAGDVSLQAVTANSGTTTVTATGGDLTVAGVVTTAGEGTSLTLKAAGGDLNLNDATDNVLGAGTSLALEATGGDITLAANTTATSLKASAAGDPAAGGDITATGKNITAPVVQADGTITVAGLTATGSETQAASVTATKLNATANVAVSDGTFSLTGAKDDGSTDSTVGGTLGLTNVDATVAGKLTVTGGLATIDGGTFEGKKGSLVTYGQGATIKNGADQKYATLAVNTAPLTVGDAADIESTRVGINELALNGQTLTVGGADNAPAMVAVNSFTDGGDPADTRANGNITVGDNGQFSYGTADAGYAAQQMAVAAANGMDTTGVSSVFAVAGATPLDMNGNDLTVGAPATPGTSVIGDDTLTIVSAAAARLTDGAGGAVNIGADNATVGENAKLFIPDAQVGASYAVFDTTGTVTLDPTAWTGANLAGDNPLVALRNDDGVINARLNSAANVMPRLDKELVGAIDAAAVANQIGTGEQFVNSPEKGVRFLSRAIAPDYLDAAANPDLAAQTIEGAARMITVGAVPQMTRAANQAAGEAVTQRTSLAQPTGIQTQEAGDHFALWIMPLYQSVNGFGMEAGNFDADFNGGLGGVAIGADYTFENAIRAGITFNIGGGYATGGGDFADTTNSMNFWGIGAYAGWTKNNFGLAADVNFTSAYNKLEQDLPAAMDMRDLKADVRSYAFSTGLRGEYKLETDVLDIIPHVGVRYMYLSTEDYKVKSEGTVLKGDGLNQNIWTFPVGVSFSKSIDTGNGWHFKPMVDLSVIPAAGDIKAKENVRFTGTDTRAELETQIMDYITYQGGLGFEVGNENLAFGLNGNVQFGAQTSGYGVLGTFRYEF